MITKKKKQEHIRPKAHQYHVIISPSSHTNQFQLPIFDQGLPCKPIIDIIGLVIISYGLSPLS